MAKNNSSISILTAILLAACGGGSSGPGSAAPDETRSGEDPLFSQQWHLKNTGQSTGNNRSAKAGEDINVEPVWSACGGNGSCKGEEVVVAVVDDGLEIRHEDLQQNVSATLQHRTYSLSAAPANGDPTPAGPDDYHGTAIGGIIAARDGNNVGVRGVAPRASLLGYGLLTASTQSNEADAMTFQTADVAVSNNSWGPPDNTGQLLAAPAIWRDAIDHGLANGRAGRGTIYVWAAGNGDIGEGALDSSNYDGYANYRGVIAVGAVNAQGKRSSYSELGANLWVSAPGGELCLSDLAITTTDRSGEAGLNTGAGPAELSNGNYTRCMNGTSSAAPVVAGVAALMLQANPGLGWRDVRTILARTARKNDADATTLWENNAAGHAVSHAYGFGVVDAAAAVDAARTWTNLPAQGNYASPVQSVNQAIPDDNATGITSSITVSNSGISRIEWVDVQFSAPDHTHSGDLLITLISPGGTRSTLAVPHQCEGPCAPHDNWRFGIARHLDERADGTWQLTVQDRAAGDIGTFQSWQISIYGH